MKKSAGIILMGVLLLLCGVSCTTKSKFHLIGVEFDIQINEITRGYIHTSFYPSTVAYYVTGCMPVNDEYDPVEKSGQFMTLMVDSLYQDYLKWRYDYLKNQEDFIADFASHSLQYGDSEKYFQNLKPDTDYWVYAFVVDPYSKEPFDNLWLQTVHTDSLLTYSVYFDTRVQGSYFYLYPRSSEGGPIVEDVPYTGMVVDSLDVIDNHSLKHSSIVSQLQFYSDMEYSMAVNYGILSQITYTGVRQINYSGKWTDGHDYFIIMGELQGGIFNRTYYRFRYDASTHTQDVKLIERDPFWTRPEEEEGE